MVAEGFELADVVALVPFRVDAGSVGTGPAAPQAPPFVWLRPQEWCMGLLLSCDRFARVGRVGVN